MDFPKKQGQRLIPDYLLDYATQLQYNHPDPSASWGGGSGGSYTGGDGINISSSNVISVDNTVAKKSDIPTNYVTTDTYQVITGQKQINNAFNFGDGDHNNIMIDADYVNRPLITMLNDTLDSAFSIGVDDGTETSITGAYFSYENDAGLREYKLPHQDATGLNIYTLATTSDLPTKTSDLTNDSGFITSSALTSYVTTNTAQTISAIKTFEGGLILPALGGAYTMEPLGVGIFRVNYTYNQHQIDFELPISKTGTDYTLATTDDIITSYNDLTDKPTIPTTATSTSTVTPTTETLVFTLSDDSTVTVNVMTGATVSTTTTLS